MSQNPKIFIIAGEVSGDLHGANLVKEIKALSPKASLYGIGGDEMSRQGVNLLFHCKDLAVVGLIEILAKLGSIIKAIRRTKKWLTTEKPDLLILIDYPEFNLMMAKHAKRAGIPVFYYISPQIWAWREGRVKKIRDCVDKMAVILPFEQQFYKKHGIDVEFVGHPLLDSVKVTTTPSDYLSSLGLDPERPVIGILPGSRHGEIARLMPIMMKSAQKIRQKRPDAQFLIPLAPNISHNDLEIPTELNVKLVSSNRYDAMAACDVLLAASGTVTLEAGLLGVPTVVTYKISPLTHILAKFLIKVKYASLVNLIANQEIFPEFIQDKARPELLSKAILELLQPERAAWVRQQLEQVRKKLGKPGAAKRAAKSALNLINA